MKKNPMPPEQIKSVLAAKNIQQAGLARDLGVAKSVVFGVIHGTTTSYRVQCHIAKAMGRPVEKVFAIKNPEKKGRPLGRGLWGRPAA